MKYADWVLGDGDRIRTNTIISLAGKEKTILDIGCCGGEIGQQLLNKNNKVYGLDISPTAVKKACSVGIIAKKNNIETENIPFRIKFDTVIAAEIIEHLADTDAFLEKVRNKLKPRGELIITTPNLATLGRRFLLLLGKNPHMEVNFETHSAGHLRYFIKPTLLNLLTKHHFKVIHFQSDIVNFSSSGKYNSQLLAKLFPTLGRTLIIKAVKTGK